MVLPWLPCLPAGNNDPEEGTVFETMRQLWAGRVACAADVACVPSAFGRGLMLAGPGWAWGNRGAGQGQGGHAHLRLPLTSGTGCAVQLACTAARMYAAHGQLAFALGHRCKRFCGAAAAAQGCSSSGALGGQPAGLHVGRNNFE